MSFLEIAVNTTQVFLSVAVVLAFYRIIKGPSLPDRVIAIDLLSYLVIGFMVTHSVTAGQPNYMDVALVLALIAFLSTIAFARYITVRKAGREQDG